jgi:regulator of PEP synthase PpsR (kinase-PPPase family)
MTYIDTSNLAVEEVVTKIITILDKSILDTKAQSSKGRRE